MRHKEWTMGAEKNLTASASEGMVAKRGLSSTFYMGLIIPMKIVSTNKRGGKNIFLKRGVGRLLLHTHI